MISIETINRFDSTMLSSLNRSLTDKQRISINTRLNKDNVKLHSVYRHKKYNIVVLGCINTNLPDNKPFYFMYWDNGQENGRGYDFMNNNNSYVLLVNLEGDQELIV